MEKSALIPFITMFLCRYRNIFQKHIKILSYIVSIRYVLNTRKVLYFNDLNDMENFKKIPKRRVIIGKYLKIMFLEK